MRKRLRGRWPWVMLGLLFGCPVLLFGIGLTVVRIGFARTAATLPDEIAAAKKAGMALEIKDIRDAIAVAPEDNAAPSYRKAMGIYIQRSPALSDEFDASVHSVLDGSGEPWDYVTVGDGLPELGDCFDALAEGSKKPGLDWNRPWERGKQVPLPEHGDIQRLEGYLCARAIFWASGGNLDAALADIRTAFKVANHIGKEPIMDAMGTDVEMEWTAVRAMLASLAGGAPTSSQLDDAMGLVAGLPELPSLRAAISGDTALARQTIHTVRKARDLYESYGDYGSGTDDSGTDDSGFTTHDEFARSDPDDWFLRDANFRKAWEVKEIHYKLRLFSAVPAEKPSYQQMREAFDDVGTDIDKDRSLENKLNIQTSWAYRNLPDSYAGALAGRRIVMQAIAILRHRLRTGSLPAGLPLSGEAAIDPFDEKPLRYRVSGKGFILYSVGRDLSDEGGLTAEEARKRKIRGHDLVAAFP